MLHHEAACEPCGPGRLFHVKDSWRTGLTNEDEEHDGPTCMSNVTGALSPVASANRLPRSQFRASISSGHHFRCLTGGISGSTGVAGRYWLTDLIKSSSVRQPGRWPKYHLQDCLITTHNRITISQGTASVTLPGMYKIAQLLIIA